MATIALAAIGGSLLPASGAGLFGAISIGSLIGGIAGGLVDNAFVFPTLFSQDNRFTNTVNGPRLDDFNIQTASEGSTINRCYGKRVRVGGTVIWMSDIIEEKVVTTTQSTSGGGGKGGGGGITTETTTTQYFYYVHAAILFCQGPVSSFHKVYADGKVIHLDQPATQEPTVQGTNLLAVDPGNGRLKVINFDNAGQGSFKDFADGVDCVVSGFSNPSNNGTFPVEATRFWDTFGSQIWLTNPDAVTEGNPTAGTVTFTQVIPQNSGADRFAFYLGDGTQPADPIIQADKGSPNTPAWRHMAVMVVERFALFNYGNRLPQFSAVMEESAEQRTVASTIAAILEDCGLDSSEYDVSLVSEDTMRGYSVAGPKPCIAQLEPLLLAFDIHVKEVGSTLVFYSVRDQTSINAGDVSATEGENQQLVPELILTDKSDYQLPSKVVVNYWDKDAKYQRGSVSERNATVGPEYVDELNLPIVFSSSEARKIARRRLWGAYQERVSGKLTIPPSYIHIQEGDEVTVTIEGETYKLLITKLTQGANFIHEVEGLVINQRLTDWAVTDGDEYDGGDDDGGPYIPPHITLELINFPALTDAHAITPGYYWVMCATQQDAEWRGASLFISGDDSTFNYWDGTAVEASLVRIISAPGDVQNPHLIDRVNTVVVQPLQGTPSSVTQTQMLNGSNRMLIKTTNGWELIGFQNATQTDANSDEWTLDTLLRGLRNSDGYTGDHVSGESIGVILNDGGVRLAEINLSNRGVTQYFKGVASGGDPDDVVSKSHALDAPTIKPFAPCRVRGSWAYDAGDYDLSLTWVRRTRSISRILGINPLPLLETSEQYEVDLLDGPGGAVQGTYSSSTAAVTIPHADLVAAGYTPGNDTVHVKVYQISSVYGRGFGREQAV
jgi:hypothetical protein